MTHPLWTLIRMSGMKLWRWLWMNGNQLWNWSQIGGSYNLFFINIFRNIFSGFTLRPFVFILCQKWLPLKPQKLIKLHFLITPCSYSCRIAFSRNVTPTIYPIFSRISDNLFSTHTFHFLLTDLIHHKATLMSDQQTTFVMLTSTDNAFFNRHDQARQQQTWHQLKPGNCQFLTRHYFWFSSH